MYNKNYLSIESINADNCTVFDFSNIIKRNYKDYDNIVSAFGNNYVPYVLKIMT